MKLRFPMTVGLLAAGLLTWSAGAVARAAQPVPAAIVLDGITTILGDNRACFKVLFTGGLQEADFMLGEGQAKYGIRLLVVDTRLNTVTISNGGLTRVIPICKTPTLLAGTAVGSGDSASAKRGGNNNPGMASAGSVPAPGNGTQAEASGPLAQTAYAGGRGQTPGSDSQNNSSGNGNGSHDAADGSDSNGTAAGISGAVGATSIIDNATQDYHWWMKEAQKVEAAREVTAQQVMDGTLQPYPLTPLTPPGTPASLIGTNREFFYFDPLAAND